MKTTTLITPKTNTKLYELIEYYEICNRCENKSIRTIAWYTANLNHFLNYLKFHKVSDSMDAIDIKVSGASRINGSITADDAGFEVSGASIVQLQGSAKNIVADVSGSSIFNLGDFVVNNADITLSGASLGTVNLNGRLDADISGASKLSYIGEPIMGDINTSGASTLSKK